MACSRRGDGESCSYTNINKDKPIGHGASRATEASSRLQKLELMVTSLMHADKNGTKDGTFHSTNGSVDERLEDLSIEPPSFKSLRYSVRGHLDVHGSEIQYVGATNWQTILENVSYSPYSNV